MGRFRLPDGHTWAFFHRLLADTQAAIRRLFLIGVHRRLKLVQFAVRLSRDVRVELKEAATQNRVAAIVSDAGSEGQIYESV